MWWQMLCVALAASLTPQVLAVWSCSQDVDCDSLAGSVCRAGGCVCPAGTQPVLGGTLCAALAPYHTSTCFDEHQCSRMTTSFQCRRDGDEETGICFCQPGTHYFLGRCWPTIDYGAACTRDEQCLSVLRDPYNLRCDVTCACAAGYYERQRGECRRIAYAVGDGCVLDDDCRFEGGVCDIEEFVCTNSGTTAPTKATRAKSQPSPTLVQAAPLNAWATPAARQHGAACGPTLACPEPFECGAFGACVCPIGYYANDIGTLCLAELGSPAVQAAQCVGLFAVIRDGVCTCPANFYFDDNMRDCIKASRRITDSCVTDSNCHTFGSAARCGAPQPPWGRRSCECVPELAVWDESRQMCRFFAGVGESCQVDGDCVAGAMDIQCAMDEDGEGVCTCPEGYLAVGQLCLTTGLDLGEECQATQECTATANSVCEGGRCVCDARGYQELDGVCAPIIGGVCELDADCVIQNTKCVDVDSARTCQCGEQFIGYDDSCWPLATGFEASCNVSAQCSPTLGAASECSDNRCVCASNHHHRDGSCWPVTGLFEGCNRSSQCYLADMSERVVCRNSLCQCEFHYPYSEELNTCLSSSASFAASVTVTLSAIIYVMFV